MAKKRNWIIMTLFFVGILASILLILTQTNIFYKNSDFSKNVYFYGEQGDSGYLVLERNSKTPSTFDWVYFENNKKTIFFSDEIIREKVYIELPSQIESGQYYFNVKAVFVSGKEEVKRMTFRVI